VCAASSVGLLTLLSLVFAVSVTGKLRDHAVVRDSLRTLLPERWVGAVATSVTAARRCWLSGWAGCWSVSFGPGSGWPGWLPPAAAVAFLAVLTVASRRRSGGGPHPVRVFRFVDAYSQWSPSGPQRGPPRVRRRWRSPCPWGRPVPPVEPAAGLVGAAAGVVLAVVVVRLDDLIDLFQPVRS
jgi:hypothetical protein